MYSCDINVLSKCIDVKNHQIHQYLTFKIFYIGKMLMRDRTNTKLQTRSGCIFKQKEAPLKVCATNTCEFKKTPMKLDTISLQSNE